MNTKKYHYIEWYSWDTKTGTKGDLKSIELYDRLNDPYETVNIAQNQILSKVVEDLSIQLMSGWQKARPNKVK